MISWAAWLFCHDIDIQLVEDVADPEKPENWRFQIVTSWLGEKDTSLDDAGRLAQVKQKAAVLPEPFRSANLWMPEDTRITYDRIAYWIPVPWDNRDGRATLCGDAAHTMTPRKIFKCPPEIPSDTNPVIDRGQGLNHAICDVTNFVEALKKVRGGEITLKDAISAYDKEVIRRGADEVLASRQNAYMMLDHDQILDSPIMTRSLEKGVIVGD